MNCWVYRQRVWCGSIVLSEVAEGTRPFYKRRGKCLVSVSLRGNSCIYTLQPLPSSPCVPLTLCPPSPVSIMSQYMPSSLPVEVSLPSHGPLRSQSLFHCSKCHLSYTLSAFYRRPFIRHPFKKDPRSHFMFSHFYYVPESPFPPNSAI